MFAYLFKIVSGFNLQLTGGFIWFLLNSWSVESIFTRYSQTIYLQIGFYFVSPSGLCMCLIHD